MRDSPILLRRMLALRQFPLFARADFGELAMVAENVVERRFAAGDVVAPADLTSLHLVVDGRLDVGGRCIEARDVHGVLNVVAHRPATAAAIASIPTHVLELAASDYIEVLEDNFGLLLAAVRDLAARVLPLGVANHSNPPLYTNSPLGLVERMILLRHQVPFAAARLEALAILAHAAVEKSWPANAIIKRPNAPADGVLILLDGTLRCGRRELVAGHAIGALETLAGMHHTNTIETLTPVRALVSHAGTILDVLEDHPDFALAMLQTFARAILDHEAQFLRETYSEVWPGS